METAAKYYAALLRRYGYTPAGMVGGEEGRLAFACRVGATASWRSLCLTARKSPCPIRADSSMNPAPRCDRVGSLSQEGRARLSACANRRMEAAPGMRVSPADCPLDNRLLGRSGA
jgi:hypothetical protein